MCSHSNHEITMTEATESLSPSTPKVKKTRTDAQKKAHREQAMRYYNANKEKVKAYRDARYERKKKEIIARSRAWVESHKEHARAYQKEYRAKNKSKLAAYFSAHFQQNKKRITDRNKKRHDARMEQDLNYAIGRKLRSRIFNAVQKQYGTKAAKTMELIGCTVQELRAHIESLWLPGMTWENWTLSGWHIDHKRPVTSYDLTDPEQQKACFHFTNLQPLWELDNIRKGNSTPAQ